VRAADEVQIDRDGRLSRSRPGAYARLMPHDPFAPLDEPFEAEDGFEEKAERLLVESDGNEDPDRED
jgi:hypothetical protein